VDPYGLAGQLVTDALNPSVYTFEVAPVFTLMESEVIRRMASLVGFQNGDGIFCPGGSFANGFAMNLARFHLNPQIKVKFLSKYIYENTEFACETDLFFKFNFQKITE